MTIDCRSMTNYVIANDFKMLHTKNKNPTTRSNRAVRHYVQIPLCFSRAYCTSASVSSTVCGKVLNSQSLPRNGRRVKYHETSANRHNNNNNILFEKQKESLFVESKAVAWGRIGGGALSNYER